MVDRLTLVNRCEACAWSTTWICYTGRLERLKLTTIRCHSKRHCSFPCHVNSKTHSIVGSHKNAFTICNLEYWTIEVTLKAGNVFVVLHACTLHLSIAGCHKNTFAIWNLEYWTIEVALWARMVHRSTIVNESYRSVTWKGKGIIPFASQSLLE